MANLKTNDGKLCINGNDELVCCVECECLFRFGAGATDCLLLEPCGNITVAIAGVTGVDPPPVFPVCPFYSFCSDVNDTYELPKLPGCSHWSLYLEDHLYCGFDAFNGAGVSLQVSVVLGASTLCGNYVIYAEVQVTIAGNAAGTTTLRKVIRSFPINDPDCDIGDLDLRGEVITFVVADIVGASVGFYDCDFSATTAVVTLGV